MFEILTYAMFVFLGLQILTALLIVGSVLKGK